MGWKCGTPRRCATPTDSSPPARLVPHRRGLAIGVPGPLDLEGRQQEVQASGLLSRAIQHELDHLNGVLLVDRMSPVQKAATAGKLKRLRKRT